ncbi:MAG: hypothetical protein QOE14_1346 [Humisphaera sp.]|nr:hypothetical protein [Humisphaera sp.]
MLKSVTEPVSLAYERTAQILFKPFSIGKWFVLGFCAWLAQLGEGGGGGNNFNWPTGGGGGGGRAPIPAPPTFPSTAPGPGGAFPSPPTYPAPPTPQQEFQTFLNEAKQFFFNHAWWIVPVAIAAVVIIIILMWVRARGKFMFLDGVANDRAAVSEPWTRLRPQANSYFRFELLLSALGLMSFAVLAGVLFLLVMPDIRAQQFGGASIAAIIIGSLVTICAVVVFGVVHAIAGDFLIPLMYLRTTSIVPAWREFRSALLPGNFWSFVLFYLMRIVLGIATAVIAMFATCATCLIAALPYIGTVLFLPLFVFHRCYSLYFLRQFGPEYNIIVERMPVLMSAFPVIMPASPVGSDMPPPMPPPLPPRMQPPPPPQEPPLGM